MHSVASVLNSYPAVGYSASIFQGTASRAFNHGFTKKGGDVHPDSRSIYEIGSVTKVFTALLLQDLNAQGTLKLNDPANKYLPSGSRVPSSHGKHVTLLHLATHTSGLPSMPPRKFVRPDDGQHPFSRFSVEDAHRFLKEVKLESPPGSRFRYSNFGYALLGHCIELATGSTYTQLLKDRICEPLGLRDTSIDLDSEQRKRFCHGYSARLAPKTHRRLEFMAPAGGIRSAAGDLAKFFNEAVLGKGPQSARLRACMTIRKKWPKDFIPKVRKDPGFQDLQAAGVGLGWLIYKLGRKTIVWHSGGTRGFSCFVGVERNTKTGIVFLTNSNGEITETGMRALLRITR